MEAGALSVRTGSLYQPGPTGPQLTAPLGACPQQASLCSPTAQEAEETAEAQAQPLPARGSLQAVAALSRGARQSGTAWLPQTPISRDPDRCPGALGAVWVVQSQGHLPAAQREGSRCHVHLNNGLGLGSFDHRS